jgi:hypothetical protein
MCSMYHVVALKRSCAVVVALLTTPVHDSKCPRVDEAILVSAVRLQCCCARNFLMSTRLVLGCKVLSIALNLLLWFACSSFKQHVRDDWLLTCSSLKCTAFVQCHAASYARIFFGLIFAFFATHVSS